MTDSTETAINDKPEWAYFAEALAWYPGHGLTGAQVFGVVQQVRQALADGRITPADLGMVTADPFGSGHGTGCASRYGHACDCTARHGRYWRVPPPKNGSSRE